MRAIRLAMMAPLVLAVGCSGGEDRAGPEQAAGDHVWKQQTRALEKAKEVDRMVQQAAQQQRRAIEEQSE